MNTVNDLPVWSGKASELPPHGVQFLYNSERYIWHPCDCKPSCQRPDVYSVISEEKSDELTVLARGDNQGYPIEDVLIKVGIITVEGLAKVYAEPDGYVPFMTDALARFDHELDKQGMEMVTNKVPAGLFSAFLSMRS